MANSIGLRQRILTATTVGQIEDFLQEGKTYTMAMDKTKRAWKNAATRRKLELQKVAQ